MGANSSCCQEPKSKAPSLFEAKLMGQMEKVRETYPESTCITMADSSGAIIAKCDDEITRGTDLGSMTVTLHKMALRFVTSLHLTECPKIHILGRKNLFSCYLVKNHYLAFFTPTRGNLFWNCIEKDAELAPLFEILGEILEDGDRSEMASDQDPNDSIAAT